MALSQRRSPRTQKKDEEFFAALRRGASVAKAAQDAGYARRSVYEWRAAKADFAAAMDDAVDEGTDLLEDEAFRRAHNGTSKPVFYKGVECGYVQEYSDTLMIFMLKGRRPEKYKDRHELGGPDGGPLTVEIVRFSDAKNQAA